jgi:drug/metabolite transporter (DMT)-like permease
MTRRAWAELLALSAIWGSSYLFIALALDGVGPFFLVLARIGGAALILAPITWRLRATLAGRWRYLPVVAVPQVALPFVLISAGEQTIDSGLAGTLVATAPLWMVVLGPVLALGRPTLLGLGGTLVGLVGVTLLLGGVGAGGPVHLGGAAMVVGAAVSYAVGATLVRRYLTGVNPVVLTGATMATATVLLLPPGVLDLPATAPSAIPVVSLVMLAVVCTAGAFVLYNRLIASVDPQRASLVAYLAPVFAVGYGALFLDEPVGPGTLAGLGLILLGSWACSRSPRPDQRTTGPAAAQAAPASGTAGSASGSAGPADGVGGQADGARDPAGTTPGGGREHGGHSRASPKLGAG